MHKRGLEIIVGLFMIVGIGAFAVLAFKVSGFGQAIGHRGYTVNAEFDNVGDLKARAPVTIAGVKIGQVTHIALDRTTFKARVDMLISGSQGKIPSDSSARILTEGLLGSNYVSLEPGYGGEDEQFLMEGSQIQETYPALVLENLIGQFLFNMNKDDKK